MSRAELQIFNHLQQRWIWQSFKLRWRGHTRGRLKCLVVLSCNKRDHFWSDFSSSSKPFVLLRSPGDERRSCPCRWGRRSRRPPDPRCPPASWASWPPRWLKSGAKATTLYFWSEVIAWALQGARAKMGKKRIQFLITHKIYSFWNFLLKF